MHSANRGNSNSISVAMCTFNGATYLPAQLQSIRNQSLTLDELVICDDNSTDDTQQTIRDFAKVAGFPVHLHVNPDRLGPAKNFERCIGLCTSQIIFTCDQDDIWHNQKVQILSDKFASAPSVMLAFSDLSLMSHCGEKLPATQWQLLGFTPEKQKSFQNADALATLLKFNVVTGTAMAFRRELAGLALPVPQGSLHDEWLALVAACVGNVCPVATPLVDYRQHQNQAVGAATTGLFAQVRHARAKMQLSYFQDRLTQIQTLLDRVESGQIKPVDENCANAIRQKRDFCRARVDMRKSPINRWPMAFHQLLKTNYHRFGYGYKSFAQDLLL